MFGMSCARAPGGPSRRIATTRRRATSNLLNDNPAAETVVFVVNRVVVELAGARSRQRAGRTALTGGQESDNVDLRTITMVRVRAALDVVGYVVVVDEHDAASHSDRRLEREQAERRNRHGRRGWRSRWRGRNRRGCWNGGSNRCRGRRRR